MRLNGAVRVIGYDGKLTLPQEKQQKNKEKLIQKVPVNTEKNSVPAGQTSAAGKPVEKQAEINTPLDTKQAAGGAK